MSGELSSSFLPSGFVSCVRMNSVQYGTIVSIFPVGGLIGSLLAGRLADKYGRRSVSISNCLGFILGPLLMSTANSIWALSLGRLLSGVSSGVSLVLVPIYLNEISPVQIRGTVGVMTQLSCVIGILLAQLAGVYLSSVPSWRMILAIGAIFGSLQLLTLFFTVESPKWLAAQTGQYARAKSLLIKIRGRTDIEAEMRLWKIEDEDEESLPDSSLEARGLLAAEMPGRSPTSAQILTLKQFLSGKKYRPALRAVFITQVAVSIS